MRQQFPKLILLILIISLGCGKPFWYPVEEHPEPQVTFPFDSANNAYFPDVVIQPPLTLKKVFRPLSAPMPDLCFWDDVLLVPTRNGRIETYDLRTFRRLARRKMPGAAHARVVPYKGDMLVALEFGKKSLFRLDAQTKKEKWAAALHGIAAFPKISGDTVFVATLQNEVVALDWNDGHILWRQSLAAQVHANPVQLDSLLIVADDSGEVLALSRKNGRVHWRYSAGTPVLADPVVFARNIVVATAEGTVLLLDAKGNVLWRRNLNTQIYRSPAACPEGIVVAAQNGNVYLLNWRHGAFRWQQDLNTLFGTRPMITQRHIILGTLNKTILFLDRESGEPVWELEVHGRVRTDFLFWRGYLIAGSEDNYVYLLGK